MLPIWRGSGCGSCWRHHGHSTSPRQDRRPGAERTLLAGFLVTLTNPKAIVLVASVFATGVTATTLVWLLAAMVALVMVLASSPVVRRFERARQGIERRAGVCFLAFASKGPNVDVRRIGVELGVRYLLQGSVRRSGGRSASRPTTSMPTTSRCAARML